MKRIESEKTSISSELKEAKAQLDTARQELVASQKQATDMKL